jgi:hypothetical protein
LSCPHAARISRAGKRGVAQTDPALAIGGALFQIIAR